MNRDDSLSGSAQRGSMGDRQGSEGLGGSTRRSSLHRASMLIRASVASAVSQVSERIEQGTVLGTALNTLCNVVGAGVLNMPMAMYNGSLGIGLSLIALCCFGCILAVYLVIHAQDYTRQRSLPSIFAFVLFPPPKTIPRVPTIDNTFSAAEVTAAQQCYSQEKQNFRKEKEKQKIKRRRAGLVVDILIIIFNIGTLIVFAKVIMNSIPPVMAGFLHLNGIWVNKYFWLLLSATVFFVLSCARRLEELKWTSLIGFATILYMVVVVVVRYATNKHREDAYGLAPIIADLPVNMTSNTTMERIHTIRYFNVDLSIFDCITTLAVAYSYQYNVPLYYRELQVHSPKQMLKTVAISFPIITLMYTLTGTLGYFMFGAFIADDVYGGNVVNIFPDTDVLINIGRLGLFFHFVCVFPILAVSAREGCHRVFSYCCGCCCSASSQNGAEDNEAEGKHRYEKPPTETTKLLTVTTSGREETSLPPPEDSNINTNDRLVEPGDLEDKNNDNHDDDDDAEENKKEKIPKAVEDDQKSRCSVIAAGRRSESREGTKEGKEKLEKVANNRGEEDEEEDDDDDDDDDPLAADLSQIPTWLLVTEAASIVIFTCGMAAIVHGINLVINLIGALSGIVIMFVLPGSMGWVLFAPGMPNVASSHYSRGTAWSSTDILAATSPNDTSAPTPLTAAKPSQQLTSNRIMSPFPTQVPHRKLWRSISLILTIIGCICSVIGVVSTIVANT